LESSEIILNYYADDPGRIPDVDSSFDDNEFVRANANVSPEWGLDLQVFDSILHYGPWADKKR
jgi:hypothetical protein